MPDAVFQPTGAISNFNYVDFYHKILNLLVTKRSTPRVKAAFEMWNKVTLDGVKPFDVENPAVDDEDAITEADRVFMEMWENDELEREVDELNDDVHAISLHNPDNSEVSRFGVL